MAITKKIADYFNKHSYEIMCSMMAFTGYVNVDLLSDLRNRKTLGERRTWGCCI